jgi:hypothetical protein
MSILHRPGNTKYTKILHEIHSNNGSISYIIPELSLLGEPERLDASPLEGTWWKPPGRDSNIKFEDVRSPRWGLGLRQLLATLCVTLSLTLFALGGADLAGGFCLRTLSFGRPMPNRGTYFEYSCHIPCYSGHDVRGVGEASKRIQHLYCVFQGSIASPPPLWHRGDMKTNGCLRAPVRPLA